jgi:hypothetical protein
MEEAPKQSLHDKVQKPETTRQLNGSFEICVL